MEVAELVRTWKRLGRPQKLVDINEKYGKESSVVDPVDEFMSLFAGWLHHGLTQRLIVIIILMSVVWFQALSLTLILDGDILTNMYPIFLLTLTTTPSGFSLISLGYLLPFKWSLFDHEQQRIIYSSLNVMILLLSLSVFTVPFLESVHIAIQICSIMLMFVYGMGFGFSLEQLMQKGRATP